MHQTNGSNETMNKPESDGCGAAQGARRATAAKPQPSTRPERGRWTSARKPADAEHLLPRVHRVASLLKRWLLSTHPGAIAHEHLDDDLDGFTFRFNRRTSASRGKLFYRLAQQAVQVDPAPFDSRVAPKQ